MVQITRGTRKARQSHICGGCFAIGEYTGDTKKDYGEEHICQGINKGDIYHYQVNVDNDIYTWKSCLPCLDFINKHNLWGEY